MTRASWSRRDGYQVQPAISIPPDATDISISPSGQVQVTQPGNATPSTVGTLELASFVNEGGLSLQGSNLLKETAAPGRGHHRHPEETPASAPSPRATRKPPTSIR